jgi:hypothetical protein
MKYIVSFSDEQSWSRTMDSEEEAMRYAKQFRNIHSAKVYKIIEVATFSKKTVIK